VVDVNMPIMDGYLFVRTVRREPAIHAMPVLMTSTQASPADHLLARQAGANFYLVKPVGQARLASVAAVLLGLPDPALQEPARPDPERPEPKLSGPKLAEPNLSEPKLSEPKLSEPKLAEPKLSEPKLSEQGRITA
jgi:DNA-binding response OmpR family regulator